MKDDYAELVASMTTPELVILRKAFILDRDRKDASEATRDFCKERLTAINAELKKRDERERG